MAEKKTEIETPDTEKTGSAPSDQSKKELKETTAEAAEKELTADDISKLTKSLKNGDSLDLGDGRIAYKIKSGDAFTRICKKILGTSSGWKKEAKKMGIDYRKIHPGQVLIFSTTPEN